MFFQRRRLSVKKARALLIELFDHRYQWPLRLPITHVLARDDPLRFLCSMRFLVDWLGQGVYLINLRQLPEKTPWYAGGLDAVISEFPRRPSNLAERLMFVMDFGNPVAAELEMRRLLLEIIDLAPKQKKRRRQEEELPLVSWLPKVAELRATSAPSEIPEGAPADLRDLARRAVRIVWRLPGSRMAALTGSVAAGYADLTSDVDISLFGLKLPEAEVRRSLIAATSGSPDDITQLSKESHASDVFWLRDRLPNGALRQIDVRYFLIDEARRLIVHPVPESQADKEILAHLSTADILVDYEFRGPDLLRDLRRVTRQAQAERVAQASAGLDQALAALLVSSDSPARFFATTEAILAFFQLLAARNDRWIVFPKWTAVWLDGLEHAPADVHQRLSAVALLPFTREHVAAKFETLRELADEIQAL